MQYIIINTEEGELRGKTVHDDCGGVYYSFQGIRYAKPPLGNLRFKAPESPEKWTGIKDATEERPGCYSKHSLFSYVVGSEDCLFLNVYTPQLPTNNQCSIKPVMVYLHGGGFTTGSGQSTFYRPDYLVNHDVVVATLNYRVGVLGFLSLEDSTLGVPGNAGFKDQIMALKWIQRNIRNFNGDQINVTIFGASAGGAAAHYIMLSPMGKGLFHKVIAQSGCALNSWTRGQKLARELALKLKFESADEAEILKFLQSLSVEKLHEAQMSFQDLQTDNLFFMDIHRSMRHHVATSSSPVYFYRFSFDGKLNTFEKFGNMTHPGACHTDDLAYLFKVHGSGKVDPESTEGKVTRRVLKLWTNFARHGDPNPQQRDNLIDVVWKPVTKDVIHFLDIDSELTAGVNPEPESVAFWDEIYKLSPATSKL